MRASFTMPRGGLEVAAPHPWMDRFVDLGFHDVTTKNERQLLDALCRRVDRTGATRIKLERLCREARLDRSSFFQAKTGLTKLGLIDREKRDGRWTTFLLPPEKWVNPPLKSREIPDKKGRKSRTKRAGKPLPANRRNAHQTAVSANGRQQIQRYSEGQTVRLIRAALSRQFMAFGRFTLDEVVDQVTPAAERVLSDLATLRVEAERLAAEFQSTGWFVGSAQLEAVLKGIMPITLESIEAALGPVTVLYDDPDLGAGPGWHGRVAGTR